jgi:hypothetical protein
MKFVYRTKIPDVAQYQVLIWEIGGKAGRYFTRGKCNNPSVLVGSNPTSHANKVVKNTNDSFALCWEARRKNWDVVQW